ncbi:MAG: hypothetical protein ACTSP3_06080, partial [Candidatus Heimdallarchaeaceae archaeon]
MVMRIFAKILNFFWTIGICLIILFIINQIFHGRLDLIPALIVLIILIPLFWKGSKRGEEVLVKNLMLTDVHIKIILVATIVFIIIPILFSFIVLGGLGYYSMFGLSMYFLGFSNKFFIFDELSFIPVVINVILFLPVIFLVFSVLKFAPIYFYINRNKKVGVFSLFKECWKNRGKLLVWISLDSVIATLFENLNLEKIKFGGKVVKGVMKTFIGSFTLLTMIIYFKDNISLSQALRKSYNKFKKFLAEAFYFEMSTIALIFLVAMIYIGIFFLLFVVTMFFKIPFNIASFLLFVVFFVFCINLLAIVVSFRPISYMIFLDLIEKGGMKSEKSKKYTNIFSRFMNYLESIFSNPKLSHIILKQIEEKADKIEKSSRGLMKKLLASRIYYIILV